MSYLDEEYTEYSTTMVRVLLTILCTEYTEYFTTMVRVLLTILCTEYATWTVLLRMRVSDTDPVRVSSVIETVFAP